jgi:transcriptional regulator with XRE-family HTH domain
MVMAKPIEPVYRQFGAKIENLRTVLGWTQQDLSKRVGLTRTSITNIEAGRQRVLLSDVERFARAFQSTPKQLMCGIWT